MASPHEDQQAMASPHEDQIMETIRKLLDADPTALVNDCPSDQLDEAVVTVVEEESKKGALPDFRTKYGYKFSEEVWKEHGVDGEEPTSEDLYTARLKFLFEEEGYGYVSEKSESTFF